MTTLPDAERSRAVLVGVSEYDRLGALPSVANNIEHLADLLTNPTIWGLPREHCLVLPNPSGPTEVLRALHTAADAATAALVFYFAGHGMPDDQSDLRLMLPGGSRDQLFDSIRFADIRREFVETATDCAARVVILDCCFSGAAVMSADLVDQQAAVEGAYLMTATTDKALALAPEGERYTAFSGVLIETLRQGIANGPDLLDMETIFGHVAGRLRAGGRPAPQCRSVGSGSRITIARNLALGSPLTEVWRRHATDHEIWERVADEPRTEQVRQSCVRFVERLSGLRSRAEEQLRRDPWSDRNLANRMSDRTRWLVGKTIDSGEAFSVAEAALVVTVPFVYETYWATLAAEHAGIAPERWARDAGDPGFWQFVSGYARLARRVEAAPDRAATAAEIGWWLLHHWIARRAVVDPPDVLAKLLARGELGPLSGLVEELLRALRADAGFVLRTDRPRPLEQESFVDGGKVSEQRIRERLVAYLLAAGHAMAIEPIRLPDILVEHLGIGDPVSLDALETTLADAAWLDHGNIRALSATCNHPAVDLALRDHVASVDRLLHEIQHAANRDSTLIPLRSLPHRVSADLIRPSTSNGRPAYSRAGVRFRLAEDRVQELLMGEQLYGNPELAIRELYQNALDACRYRAARGEYLERTTNIEHDWTGRISFVQGVDDEGRPYLDCVDNGIGMGERELSEVFSHSGVRFADLPDFLEEQSAWARLDPPVGLYPNSRFGIGVLSYFMLADEISVDTCRFDRTGRLGDRLTVTIAGPGTLFRMVNHGPGTKAGTRVRLYLRKTVNPLSCVAVLRRLLWVAQFATSADDGTTQLHWPAGDLAASAPLGMSDYQPTPSSEPPDAVVAWGPAGGSVWWYDAKGAVLVDGIWLQEGPYGAAVDLRGHLAPPLSVDRNRILNFRLDDVLGLLMAAVPVAAAPDNPVFSHQWLSRLVNKTPGVADAVFAAALAAGWERWPGDDSDALRIAGCFPPDQETEWLPIGLWGVDRPRQFASLHAHGPLAQWRATSWAAAGGLAHALTVAPETRVVPARPSDAILLAADPLTAGDPDALRNSPSGPWRGPRTDEPVTFDRLLTAAIRLNWSVHAVGERLADLGYAVPDRVEHLPVETLGRADIEILADDSSHERPWLIPPCLGNDEPVPAELVIAAAGKLGTTAHAVADRLTALGYTTAGAAYSDHVVSRDDFALIAVGLTNQAPWLPSAEQVPIEHVIAAAGKLGTTAHAVADRLTALGYTTTSRADLPAGNLDGDDTTMVSAGLDTRPPWLPLGEPVGAEHLIAAAGKLGTTAHAVADRLTALGYTTTSAADLPTGDLDGGDALVISQDVNFDLPWSRPPVPRQPWFDRTGRVPAWRLVVGAARLGTTTTSVAERLGRLGFLDVPSVDLSTADHVLLSANLAGTQPWWDAWTPVPAHHLIAAAVELEADARDLFDRLLFLGYTCDVDRDVLPIGPLSESDAALLDPDFADRSEWLSRAEEVSASRLVMASIATSHTLRSIVDRFVELGYSATASTEVLGLVLTRTDATIVSTDFDGEEPWLAPSAPVPWGHVVTAAATTGQTVQAVADRLRQFGFTVVTAAPRGAAVRANRNEVILLGQDLDSDAPWIAPSAPIPASHLLAGVERLGRTLQHVAERLRALGYSGVDLQLTTGRPGDAPWYEAG
ncbi:caspase family protein [Dactylosporangium sp. AC04546]|uniref:caspase, EACC1-associated type n=1 Tax=Dactylosporangium sp. AC04546 TaxID=2862460 RepID=UPI001EE12F62|nr:caspase family protein [Dactylosporangium sp. AC04546]WVK87905.1 caspase family protein [Dactylosporangium sp. AC04546]